MEAQEARRAGSGPGRGFRVGARGRGEKPRWGLSPGGEGKQKLVGIKVKNQSR